MTNQPPGWTDAYLDALTDALIMRARARLFDANLRVAQLKQGAEDAKLGIIQAESERDHLARVLQGLTF